MELYEATNGFMGFSYVRCLVYANSYDEALGMAREHFKKDGEDGVFSQPDNYWKDVKLKLLLDTDVDGPLCTEITD